MSALNVIIRGRIERKEFNEPLRQCLDMLQQTGVNPAGFDQVGHNLIGIDEPIDFAIFFQSYPHEFLPSGLIQLRRQNPFAPFFFVLGTCCEGMFRTAGGLDSSFYRYAHAWNSNDTEEIRRFLTGQPSLFALPMTAENDEIALWCYPAGKKKDASFGGGQQNVPSPFGGCFHTRARVGVNLVSSIAPTLTLPPWGEGTCIAPPEKCLILTQFGHFGNDSAMNRLLADQQRNLGFEPIFWRQALNTSPLSHRGRVRVGSEHHTAQCPHPNLSTEGEGIESPFSGKILADADDAPAAKILDSIQRLRHRFADNDFTVYVDSPRINEKSDFVRAGVTRVLPKMR